MKKFSRCALILILVSVISGIAGFFYFDNTTIPVYSSTTKLYITPGADNEASLRARDGGLNDDFMIIFKSGVVISAAQTKAGTSEDIAKYLTVNSPADSNIIEITCTNPDKNTAKKYADAVAATAIKTTSIIPVDKIQILSEGTIDDNARKPYLIINAFKVMGAAAAAVLCVEILVLLIIAAFKNKEDEYDDELEYERKYGRFAAVDNLQKEQVKENAVPLAELEQEPEKEAAVTKEQEDIFELDEPFEDIDLEIENEADTDIITEEAQQKSKPSAKIFGRIRK
ncbi:MAG: hypothetical protein Q4F11_04300 [Eubacteriales bacterium]|nr:hypothetical protein [Eubacteriales bacterium]